MECHSKRSLKIEEEGREKSLYFDVERARRGVHAATDCIDCHEDLEGVTEYPHATNVARVDCGTCHDEDMEPQAAYWKSSHGRLAKAGNANAPLCQDCHGDHYVLRRTDPEAATAKLNIAQMCTFCHAEGQQARRMYGIPADKALERYPELHGPGLLHKGLQVTAVCTSCHTGHNVRPHTDPASTIHADNVVKTCTQCHGRVDDIHRDIVKPELWKLQGTVPACVDCHAPHRERRVFYRTGLSNAECLHCHGKEALAGNDRSLHVAAPEFEHSIHGRRGVACAQCHTGVTPSPERPCSTIKAPVDCATCHDGQTREYQRGTHGKLHATGNANAPACTDCHGTHEILEHRVSEKEPEAVQDLVRRSPTYVRNVPALCARCHRDGAPAASLYLGDQTKIIEHYRMSIHGKGLIASGLTVTATCTSCHSAHKELPRSDPESTVHPDNIAATCGRCHDGVYERYKHSIHSPVGNADYVQLHGMSPLPRCNDCHSPHTIARTDLGGFKLGIMEQCGKCHEKVTETYFETYHGKASALGNTTRAKCYDCHGSHDIRPPSDPVSTLHPDHIVGTCGKCHPGAHQEFAAYLPHATHHDRERYPALFYAFWGMTALLLAVFSFFGLHTLAWLPRSMRLRKEHRALRSVEDPGEKQYMRFNVYNRRLHLMIIVSFFGLAITGMMLKFSHAGWAALLSKLLGGMEMAGWIHRACAIITFAYFFLHLWDVWRRYRRGKKTLREFLLGPDTLLPTWRDVREFGATIRWFVGKGERPRYGRWTYWEKFDYFAVFWGVAIIGTTGLCLWFPESVTRFLPGWAINVATIIHSDEALLAVGFIFTIHFFNTHFRPEKFPIDTVMFTGRVSLEELQRDKPELYEQLKASGELERRLVEPASPVLVKVARAFGFTAVAIGFLLVALIIYSMLVQG